MRNPADKPVKDSFLEFEHGLISLGGEQLPGIFVDISVGDGIRYDYIQLEGMSGTKKIIMGWEDSAIRVTLDLLCDYEEVRGEQRESTCYDKLRKINDIFRKTNKYANPLIYEITNSHMWARGITKVVFESLESRECTGEDVIQATLTFVEHMPPVIKREKQVVAAGKAARASGSKTPAIKPSAGKVPPASPSILQDDDSPFMAGFKAGKS